MFHRSARLLLRPVWPEDWQAVYGGIADEGVVRNLARAPWPYSKQDARDFASRPAAPHEPRFLITTANNGQVVGCIGLDAQPCDYPGAVEIGYWIAREHWGKGYATEAGCAVLKIAQLLGYPRVYGSHFLDNPASGAVLEKLGFEPTGRVIERHSCGRGEVAMTAEYMKSLADAVMPERRAGQSQLSAA
ncbi:GNAT family N-acetyltransferase [Erythrobacter sp. SCSIO 43205]|uniref:GNAT family N-acetyltransferase n=1 Tax=Erythrobacter sp. SCSIO 43205 TaxID=2779361 RepID=UPI001CA85814|nr:GNAT family N-acetyltransferase [Erythrobacter sp. SCSIO 43205]UAB79518.1 GNAT family N-acetyltransferase [Erythrobacter sp. SCSIO 43205]